MLQLGESVMDIIYKGKLVIISLLIHIKRKTSQSRIELSQSFHILSLAVSTTVHRINPRLPAEN